MPEAASSLCAFGPPVLASLLRSLSSAEASFWVYRRSLRAFRQAFSRTRATGEREVPVPPRGMCTGPSSVAPGPRAGRLGREGARPISPQLEPSRREGLAGTLGASTGKPPDPPRPGGSERSSEASTGRPKAHGARAASRKPLPPAGQALALEIFSPSQDARHGVRALRKIRRPPRGDERCGREDGRKGFGQSYRKRKVM